MSAENINNIIIPRLHFVEKSGGLFLAKRAPGSDSVIIEAKPLKDHPATLDVRLYTATRGTKTVKKAKQAIPDDYPVRLLLTRAMAAGLTIADSWFDYSDSETPIRTPVRDFLLLDHKIEEDILQTHLHRIRPYKSDNFVPSARLYAAKVAFLELMRAVPVLPYAVTMHKP